MRSVKAIFFLNAVIWLALGISNISRIPSYNPEQVITAWVIAVLMFGNAAAMLLSGVVVFRFARLGYAFALAVLGINILLTFTDQVGALDLVTLFIDLVLLCLLLISHKWVS